MECEERGDTVEEGFKNRSSGRSVDDTWAKEIQAAETSHRINYARMCWGMRQRVSTCRLYIEITVN